MYSAVKNIWEAYSRAGGTPPGAWSFPRWCSQLQAKAGYSRGKWFCLCWGLTSQSTIFQSCRDGAIASWVINQYFRGVKCLAQGHNTAAVGFEPPTSRSGVRHSTTEPPRSPRGKWYLGRKTSGKPWFWHRALEISGHGHVVKLLG